MGYTSDTPVSLDRSIRQNDACVWIADETALRTVEERVRSLLPQEVGGGRLMGLNARWRCYRCTALPRRLHHHHPPARHCVRVAHLRSGTD